MRRKFVASVQYTTAQLDYDSATHIAAMQGAIAAATKIAHKALEDAARAQEAAARARNAATEALQWADRAKGVGLAGRPGQEAGGGRRERCPSDRIGQAVG
ncbi:hypothetical protein A8W25_16140 [Streptomyces sp. ERV7]|uniref:hypothetical protein n=1 Tax=Streptomyces sp. ERV7 TaxID=1322334 RepID=UPI0007F4ACFE|nr:hypothetical protein [Streptomyces sp. ERV7]OAR23998.1 hypothetical protein A8W25_16140 [Streptomyces sp. ERV7]